MNETSSDSAGERRNREWWARCGRCGSDYPSNTQGMGYCKTCNADVNPLALPTHRYLVAPEPAAAECNGKCRWHGVAPVGQPTWPAKDCPKHGQGGDVAVSDGQPQPSDRSTTAGSSSISPPPTSLCEKCGHTYDQHDEGGCAREDCLCDEFTPPTNEGRWHVVQVGLSKLDGWRVMHGNMVVATCGSREGAEGIAALEADNRELREGFQRIVDRHDMDINDYRAKYGQEWSATYDESALSIARDALLQRTMRQ